MVSEGETHHEPGVLETRRETGASGDCCERVYELAVVFWRVKMASAGCTQGMIVLEKSTIGFGPAARLVGLVTTILRRDISTCAEDDPLGPQKVFYMLYEETCRVIDQLAVYF